ncbi:hypothetical protein C2G38_2142992 [Gigaspora rosea]|uniref:Uncharacterized protein n=1 Tax=Gigaspora rosea TaxID=44941 RepID=A0A397V403_9GLOM|nr:hypothetical protein C2G38_2142992 [Gigaspora rosea]
MLHATNGTLIYYYSNDGGKNFIQLTVDLSKAGATVGSQGILQSVYLEGNDTSPTNTTLYECADIKITAESTTQAKTGSGSINKPHPGFTLFNNLFTLFIGLFLFSYLIL